MMGTRRLYVPLSVSTHLDDRIAAAGDAGELLWYRLLQVVKANETDGTISCANAVKLHSKRAVDALVEHDLLRPTEDGKGYRLAGWLSWNLASDQIDAQRRADRDRKRPTGNRPEPPLTPVPGSGRNPNGTPPESERNPNGIQANSAGFPTIGKGREGKLRTDSSLPLPISSAEPGSGNGFTRALRAVSDDRNGGPA